MFWRFDFGGMFVTHCSLTVNEFLKSSVSDEGM